MLLCDLGRRNGGRGTYPLVPGAATAPAAPDECANNVASDPVDWLAGDLAYHLGLLEGVARPDDPAEESCVSDVVRECPYGWLWWCCWK